MNNYVYILGPGLYDERVNNIYKDASNIPKHFFLHGKLFDFSHYSFDVLTQEES